MTNDNFMKMQKNRIGKDLNKHSDNVYTHRFIFTHFNEVKPDVCSIKGFILSFSDDSRDFGKFL